MFLFPLMAFIHFFPITASLLASKFYNIRKKREKQTISIEGIKLTLLKMGSVNDGFAFRASKSFIY